MTRRGTVINHSILSSSSFSEYTEKEKLVWVGFLLCADDWGRLHDNPSKLRMKMPSFDLSTSEISEAIEKFINLERLIRYTVQLPSNHRTVTVLQLSNWEIYQSRLKSRDYPELPNSDGNFEKTTNPAALSKILGSNKLSKDKKNKDKKKIKIKIDGVQADTMQLPCGEIQDKQTTVETKEKAPTRKISDTFYELYEKEFKTKPSHWGSGEMQRIQELLKRYDDDVDLICNTLRYMFDNDDLWTKNKGSFMSFATSTLIDRAISFIKNPKIKQTSSKGGLMF